MPVNTCGPTGLSAQRMIASQTMRNVSRMAAQDMSGRKKLTRQLLYLFVGGGGRHGNEFADPNGDIPGGGGGGGKVQQGIYPLNLIPVGTVLTVTVGAAQQQTTVTGLPTAGAGANGEDATFVGGPAGAAGTIAGATTGGGGGGSGGGDGAGAGVLGGGGGGGNVSAGFQTNPLTSSTGGTGGAGVMSNITGTLLDYGSGGGGGYSGLPGGPGASAGRAAPTGFARGGGGDNPGCAIFAYPSGTMLWTGGTITQANGNTIHTFTSSGSFTRVA